MWRVPRTFHGYHLLEKIPLRINHAPVTTPFATSVSAIAIMVEQLIATNPTVPTQPTKESFDYPRHGYHLLSFYP